MYANRVCRHVCGIIFTRPTLNALLTPQTHPKFLKIHQTSTTECAHKNNGFLWLKPKADCLHASKKLIVLLHFCICESAYDECCLSDKETQFILAKASEYPKKKIQFSNKNKEKTFLYSKHSFYPSMNVSK